MSQPVKLSDGLVLEARIAGEAMERSIAGQVEFWAQIGRAVEMLATRTQMVRMRQRSAMPLAEIVSTIEEPTGRARLKSFLDERPYPRFVAHPELTRTFIREDENGSRTTGRFERGVFRVLEEQKERTA